MRRLLLVICALLVVPLIRGQTRLSDIQNPAANSSWNMGAYRWVITYGSNTGPGTMFDIGDSSNNRGTGYLVRIRSAPGSLVNPFTAMAGTNGVILDVNGMFRTVGSGSINATHIRSMQVSTTTPTINQVLRWNGTVYEPFSLDTQFLQSAGDIGGAPNNPQVRGFYGRPLTNSSPRLGQVPRWDGTSWVYSSGLAKNLSWDIEQPSINDAGLWQHTISDGGTLTEVSCSTVSGSAQINLEIRSRNNPNVPGTLVLSAPLTCSTTVDCGASQGCTSTIVNSNIPADSVLAPVPVSVANVPLLRVHAHINP